MLQQNQSYEAPAKRVALELPRIVYACDHPDFVVDSLIVAGAMDEIGVSPESVASTTVYMDEKSRSSVNGSVWPRFLGRLRFFGNPELRNSSGSIVRLSTVKCGKRRSVEAINRTLVHELKHVAQIDQKDSSLIVGNVTHLGLTVLGVLAAHRVTEKSSRIIPRLAIGLGGLLIGSHTGYRLALHERHARVVAEIINTNAVSVSPHADASMIHRSPEQ